MNTINECFLHGKYKGDDCPICVYGNTAVDDMEPIVEPVEGAIAARKEESKGKSND